MGYFLNLYRGKIDRLEKDNQQMALDISTNRVTREELLAYLSTIREDRQHMHEENKAEIRDLRSEFRAIHERIDELLNRGRG